MNDMLAMRYEATIDDPVVFTRPWKISMPLYRRVEPNAQLMDFRCQEFVEELAFGHLTAFFDRVAPPLPKVVAFVRTEVRQALAEERPERLGAATIRTRAFSFAKHSSIGLRSAIGRQYQSVAPAAWMARWIPATLCAPRLSAMTRSPGCRVGTKICSM